MWNWDEAKNSVRVQKIVKENAWHLPISHMEKVKYLFVRL